MLMKNSILTILFLLLFASTSLAQNDFEIGGYAKYLFSTAKYPQFDERLFDHIIHSRLNTKYFFDESLSLTGEFRFRTFFGNSVKKFPDYSEFIKTNQPLLKLDWMIWKNRNIIGYAEADRLYFDYNANNFQLTLGRQRIAWGTVGFGIRQIYSILYLFLILITKNYQAATHSEFNIIQEQSVKLNLPLHQTVIKIN